MSQIDPAELPGLLPGGVPAVVVVPRQPGGLRGKDFNMGFSSTSGGAFVKTSLILRVELAIRVDLTPLHTGQPILCLIYFPTVNSSDVSILHLLHVTIVPWS